ncbi:DUF5010 C-terminal domain-containing protein [Pontiellaceae bacterium B12227]|nr:DUF5010 C-terminal domain-containing protein [Pontiellaceae bacterium B12227]
MRKQLILFALMPSMLWAATYYVDQASVEVAQDGSATYPYKTITQAAAAMSPGDTCIIHAGTYRERVVVQDNNVTFRRYGNDKVTVSGADLLTGWTLHSGNIYKAPLSWSGHEFTQVFYQGDHQQIARHPDNITGNMLSIEDDSGYMACETFNDTGATRQVAFPSMAAVPTNFWAGGIYRGITGRIRSNTMGDIISSSGTDLVCTPLSNEWKDDAKNGEWYMGGDAKGYILHLNALSREGEWWHEGGFLHFWQPGGGMPDDISVEAQVREEAFSIANRTGVVLDGIDIIGATMTVDNSDYCRFENCSFEYVQPYIKPSGYSSSYGSIGGVYMNGDSNVVDACYFDGSWGHLLYLEGGTGNEIRNSVLKNNGWYSIFSSCVHINGAADTLIEYCTFGSTGRFHVRMDTNAKNTIRYCDFSDCMNMGQDAGSIQSVGKNLNDSEFAYNSIHDSDTIEVINTGGKQFVVAFYIEDTSDYTAHHNVVWNFNNDDIPGSIPDGSFSYLGPRDTTQSGIRYYNNTVWDCDYRIRIWNRYGLGSINTEHWNNIFDSSMADVFGTPSLEPGFDFRNNVSLDPANEGSWFENAPAGDFQPLPASGAMDAGLVIAGITDGFTGSAPDAGAIEENTFMWRTGASIAGNHRQQPLGGTPHTIPGAAIRAADYDEGGAGLAYHDLTRGNDGGIYRADDVDLVASPGGTAVGSTVGGEWLEYTVDVVPGTYRMRLKASAVDSNRTIRIQLDGMDLATVPVPDTGNLNTYQTLVTNVTVTTASCLRVCFDTGGTNLESIEFQSEVPIAIDYHRIVGTDLILGFTNGPVNSSFSLYSKTNLMDTVWNAVQTNLPTSGSGAGEVTNSTMLPVQFFRLAESILPAAGPAVIEFIAPDYVDGLLDGQQSWNAESGWEVGDSAGAGHAFTPDNGSAAVVNDPVQLSAGETYRLSINLQFGGTYSAPTNYVYTFLGGLKANSDGASVLTGSTAADANIQLFGNTDKYRLLSNYATIPGAANIDGQLNPGDILQFDYELTLGTAASNTVYTVRLRNLTDADDTGTGTVTGVDQTIYDALTGSGAYGFFQSISPGARASGLSSVQVNSVSN